MVLAQKTLFTREALTMGEARRANKELLPAVCRCNPIDDKQAFNPVQERARVVPRAHYVIHRSLCCRSAATLACRHRSTFAVFVAIGRFLWLIRLSLHAVTPHHAAYPEEHRSAPKALVGLFGCPVCLVHGVEIPSTSLRRPPLQIWR